MSELTNKSPLPNVKGTVNPYFVDGRILNLFITPEPTIQ